jgi:hypothetical protein
VESFPDLAATYRAMGTNFGALRRSTTAYYGWTPGPGSFRVIWAGSTFT